MYILYSIQNVKINSVDKSPDNLLNLSDYVATKEKNNIILETRSRTILLPI